MLQVYERTVSVGAAAPFAVLHLSDTHLTRADARDGQRKVDLAAARFPVFPGAEEAYAQAQALALRERLPIIHTGDLNDFVSEANLEESARFTGALDVFTAAGNHEFSLYVGEAKEDAAYREQSLARVQAAFTNDIRFSSRVINGVKFVALDNSYYLVEPWQLARLKKEAAEGLPMVLCMHTPLYSAEEQAVSAGQWGKPPYYLMAAPEAVLATYPEDRYIQQKADETTLEAFDFMQNCPMIRCVLAGHIHKGGQVLLNGRLPQLTVGLNEACVVRFT